GRGALEHERGHVDPARQDEPDRRQQHLAPRRLRDEARGPAFERSARIRAALRSREDHDGYGRMLPPQDRQGLEAAHAWKVEVEEHEIEVVVLAHDRERALRIPDADELDRIVELTQHELQAL